MRELSRVMPEGSWLQSSDASVTGDVEGATPATDTGTAVAPSRRPTLSAARPTSRTSRE